MAEQLRITSIGDLEASVLAESYDLLGSIVGPNMYSVSGLPDQQQAVFASREVQALFYIRVHEFLATAPKVPAVPGVPANLSLFSAGGWLSERYPLEAKESGLQEAYGQAETWFQQVYRIVFWAPSVWRHLRLELPMSTLIAMRANLEKHQLLRLDREIRRLRSRCKASGCPLTMAETVAVREEFEDHLRGMLEYHATEVTEQVGRCFHALYRFVRQRYLRTPTNNLDLIPYPDDISDEVFRYMYTSTIQGLAGWTDGRILSSIPETASCFKGPYPQHAEWSIVDAEQSEAG
jgi:hypothetical protein